MPLRALAWLTVALVAIVSVIPAPQVTLWPDTIRDLSASLALARGEKLVLVGPAINFGPHLGPTWIWLQAIPLIAVQTLQSAAIWVALVAALKFPLLYAIGRTLGGPRLGLCVVAAAAYPSIAVFQWNVFMHPNWVEAAVALTLLLVVCAIRRRSVLLAQLAALALGFALQMHPTALFYAPLVAWALYACSDRKRFPLHALLAAGLVAIWFAPIPFAPDAPYEGAARSTTAAGRCAEHRGGQVECAQDFIARIGRATGEFNVADVATVLRTAYVDIPLASGESALGLGMASGIWRGALAVALLVALGGVGWRIARGPDRGAVATLAGALLLGWTISTALREYTAFWACYFLMPLSAIVLGAGLDRWTSSTSTLARTAGVVGCSFAIATFFVAAWGARSAGEAGVVESRLPLLGELKHPGAHAIRANLMTVGTRDALAREICAVPRATLHGDLAYALAGSTGLDLRMHCPSRRGGVELLGGAAAGEAWTALPLADARRLGKEPRARLKGVAALPVKRVLHPASGMPIDEHWDYFERLLERGELRTVKLEFSTDAGEAVMVYRLKPFAAAWHNFRVLSDGAAAVPALSTYNSEVFVSGTHGPTAWRIEFDTDAPQWVDVHVF